MAGITLKRYPIYKYNIPPYLDYVNTIAYLDIEELYVIAQVFPG